jgi:eukaryotic-like serine/threonine-protein kinase
MERLVDAFATAQEAGISHRDIKPENLILNDNMNEFKIVDFGLGADIEKDEDMEIEYPVGTELYFSPELRTLYHVKSHLATRRKKTRYNPYKSDVYALGITILKMMGLGRKEILKFVEDIKVKIE